MKPNRKARKVAKLKARGTYRRRDQWKLDKAHEAVVLAAERLAPHLNLTVEGLLDAVGYTR